MEVHVQCIYIPAFLQNVFLRDGHAPLNQARGGLAPPSCAPGGAKYARRANCPPPEELLGGVPNLTVNTKLWLLVYFTGTQSNYMVLDTTLSLIKTKRIKNSKLICLCSSLFSFIFKKSDIARNLCPLRGVQPHPPLQVQGARAVPIAPPLCRLIVYNLYNYFLSNPPGHKNKKFCDSETTKKKYFKKLSF